MIVDKLKRQLYLADGGVSKDGALTPISSYVMALCKEANTLGLWHSILLIAFLMSVRRGKHLVLLDFHMARDESLYSSYHLDLGKQFVQPERN